MESGGEELREFRTYNDNGLIMTYLCQKFKNGEWVNEDFSSNTYDENGNRLIHLDQYWHDGVWTSVKIVYLPN